MSDAPRPDLVTQTEICARLGITAQTWIRWRAAKRTPEAIRMPSGRFRWRRADIDALVGNPETPERRPFELVARRRA